MLTSGKPLVGTQKAVPRGFEQLSSKGLQNLTSIGEMEPESRFSGSIFFECTAQFCRHTAKYTGRARFEPR